MNQHRPLYSIYRYCRRYIKNGLTYVLMGLFRVLFPRRFHWDAKLPRILIVATTALGDTMWLTPLLPAIKQRYPTAHVGVLASPIAAQVLVNNPYIDELIVLSGNIDLSALKMVPMLRRKRFQAVILSHASQRMMMPVIYMTGASIRIAWNRACKGLNRLMTIIDDTDLAQIHAVEGKFVLAKHLDIPRPEQPLLQLYFTPTEQAAAQEWLVKHRDPEKLLVGMVPGASKPIKRWPAEHFIALGQWLNTQQPAQFLVIGSPAEQTLCASIAEPLTNAINLAGELPLRIVMAVITQLDLMITNDTGPMHVASSAQVPILAFLGRQERQTHLYPYNPGPKALLGPDESQLLQEPKLGIRDISIEQAIQALQILLKQSHIGRKS
jgi:ADP-heptose:LPS heptosyltransferase